MKLSRSSCKIVGLRIGELKLDTINPPSSLLIAKFVLLKDPTQGDDNINAGQYTKHNWSPTTIEAMNRFIECAESDAIRDLFGEGEEVAQATTQDDPGLKFPSIPVLGRSSTKAP